MTPPEELDPASNYARSSMATTTGSALVTTARNSTGSPFFVLRQFNSSSGDMDVTHVVEIPLNGDFNIDPETGGLDFEIVMCDSLSFVVVAVMQTYEANATLLRSRGILQTFKLNETTNTYVLTRTEYNPIQALGYAMWMNRVGDKLLVTSLVYDSSDQTGNNVTVYTLDTPESPFFTEFSVVLPVGGTPSWGFGADIGMTGMDEWIAISDNAVQCIYMYNWTGLTDGSGQVYETIPGPTNATVPGLTSIVGFGRPMTMAGVPSRLVAHLRYQIGVIAHTGVIVIGMDNSTSPGNWTVAEPVFLKYTNVTCVFQGGSLGICGDGGIVAFGIYDCADTSSYIVTFTDIGYGNTTEGIWNDGVRQQLPTPYNTSIESFGLVDNAMSYNGSYYFPAVGGGQVGANMANFWYTDVGDCSEGALPPSIDPPPLVEPPSEDEPPTIAPSSPPTPSSDDLPLPEFGIVFIVFFGVIVFAGIIMALRGACEKACRRRSSTNRYGRRYEVLL